MIFIFSLFSTLPPFSANKEKPQFFAELFFGNSLFKSCIHYEQEPLPGEFICPRDQRRRQSESVSSRWVKDCTFKFYYLLLQYRVSKYFNCSLQCLLFEVWKGLPRVHFRLLIFSKWLSALVQSLRSGSTQLTLKWEKMTKSSVKNNGHSLLESYRS